MLTAGIGIASAAISVDNSTSDPPGNANADVVVRLKDPNKAPESYDTSACYVDARPELEFYIDGEDIAQIEVTCGNEYLYAIDWTGHSTKNTGMSNIIRHTTKKPGSVHSILSAL